MSAKKHVTEERKAFIFELYKLDLKPKRIAHLTSLNVKTVYGILSRGISRDTTNRAKGSGRKTEMTPRMIRALVREVNYNRRATLAELAAFLPKAVSVCTVRRALHKMGYRNRVAQKKPFLSIIHRKRRLDFAKKYKSWTVED